MRAVFDVNVLFRAVIGSVLVARLIERATDGEFILLSGRMLLMEFDDLVRRPRAAQRVDWSAYNTLIDTLAEDCESIEPKPPFPTCRDPDDCYLLAMARDGGADFLVTNDADLLVLDRIADCEILTPEEFGRRMDAARAG